MIGESFNDFINVSSPIKIGSKSRPASNSPKNKDDDSVKKESAKKNAKLNKDLIKKAMRNQPATVRVSSLKGSSAKKSMGGFGKLGAFDFSEIDEKEEDKKDDE